MCSAHYLQLHDLVDNVIKKIKRKTKDIEIAIQYEAAFQTDEERKKIYKRYTKQYQ